MLGSQETFPWPVEIIRCRRKSVGIRVTEDGNIVVRAPLRTSGAEIRRILEGKRDWIEKALARIREREALPKLTEEEIKALARQAKAVIPPRVELWARRAGVSYGRITIRCQKSRWGSCSAQGNLNFNCLLMLCPQPVLDYVVAHELCHRKEMNHSPKFWTELEKYVPDYKALRKWLKDEGSKLIARM